MSTLFAIFATVATTLLLTAILIAGGYFAALGVLAVVNNFRK